MHTSATSSGGSPPASLSPSSAGGSGSSNMAPTLPAVSAPKPRKKPGPKPKPKAAELRITVLKISPARLAALHLPNFPQVEGTPHGSSPSQVSPQTGPVEPGNSDASLAPPAQRRRGVPGPKPGTKRVRQPALGKPGRKKTKMDPNNPAGAVLNGVSYGAHGKPGPKANTGAINAQLRALDRSGKPCKRWTKTGFTLKSFTGVEWTLPTWAAPASRPQPEASPSENTGTASVEPSIAADTPPDIRIVPDYDVSSSTVQGSALPQGIPA